MKYFIKTFGCQQNIADSERVAQAFESRGFSLAKDYDDANYVIINTCMVRESAENRVYGLVNNLAKLKDKKAAKKEYFKIIVTGCMVGIAFRDKTGKYLDKIRTVMPQVDEFMPIEEIGFDNEPVRQDSRQAWVPISNGCNNFCTFCVVPFTRGREISRPFADIMAECEKLKRNGFTKVTLLGQNVNSYGADLLVGEKNIQVMRDIDKTYFRSSVIASKAKQSHDGIATSSPTPRNDKDTDYKGFKPVYVKHLGRYRIPTLFPQLLDTVAKIGFETVDFISSNPWDFSDELIDVIAKNENVTRTLHLPIQSGDDAMLKRMNRWYTAAEYLELISKLKNHILNLKLTTDIIVGFCGETEKEFESTYNLAKKVGYEKAYIAMYSQRPMTAATKVFNDDVPHTIKKSRWEKLNTLINIKN